MVRAVRDKRQRSRVAAEILDYSIHKEAVSIV